MCTALFRRNWSQSSTFVLLLNDVPALRSERKVLLKGHYNCFAVYLEVRAARLFFLNQPIIFFHYLCSRFRCRFSSNGSLKNQQQPHRHKCVIWLVDRGKIIVDHVLQSTRIPCFKKQLRVVMARFEVLTTTRTIAKKKKTFTSHFYVSEPIRFKVTWLILCNMNT